MLTTMPIWIRLPGLSFKLWGNKALRALASTISAPIKLDEVIKNKMNITFARVLVDMKAEVRFPNVIEV